ncbi:hypothetical protein AF335_04085 [Streptomyces eurocidicus]|uniref:Gram-positive cocci surface proteins LPxTG domain-containing protein n=1 Tax=Streptomyces eurocidicus TaxID=66423 RepID=A0A2N8P3A7_STREU|nr:hypothetical protein [Streptomyces eurocidicus]MBB5117703.1 hypothetical protein [Streptomyces eurocidicus]MBF6053538.1 hypothetical protein [Streptomyces eurocidicus]PNE35502.1 hypothetical protein AF335_04085 [Streptomyces eurocidicus]
MSLPRALVVGAAALAVFTTAAPASPVHPDDRPPDAAAAPGRPRDRAPVEPGCATPGSSAFPITARLSGGPEAYERGGAPHTWQLELRNTTAVDCRGVHPVAVLADRGRMLQPSDVRLDFYDDGAARWRPVTLERTDEAENVGVFEGRSPDFTGFAVPAHRALPVRVRLGFTGRAPEGPVTLNITAVQRRAGDGDWVGESDDYTFGVERSPDRESASAGGRAKEPEETLADTGSQRPLFAIGAAAFALILAGGSLLFGRRR